MALGFPCFASFSISGPPGYCRPKILATLSNASPAASSTVSPSFSHLVRLCIFKSIVCPPLTTRPMAGNWILSFRA